MQAADTPYIVLNLDIGTAPGHIGRHRNGTELTRIGNNRSFFFAAYSINNAAFQTSPGKFFAQDFAFVDILGTNQHRTAKRMHLDHLINNRRSFRLFHVLCNNPDKGPQVRKVCGVGCMGCHLCERNSGGKEANHFTFQGFLAKVNYENPPTDEQIVPKCPAKCMSVDPHFESGH